MGRVRTQKCYLCCHTNLDSSVYYNGQSESQEGRREGVDVMKDEDLNLEEIEVRETDESKCT